MAEKRTRRRFAAEFNAQAVKRVIEDSKGLTKVGQQRWRPNSG